MLSAFGGKTHFGPDRAGGTPGENSIPWHPSHHHVTLDLWVTVYGKAWVEARGLD